MTTREQLFFTYWKTNMFRKISAPTDKVLEAYAILYGKSYPGCKTCNMAPVAQELKNVFHRLLKEEEEKVKATEAEVDRFGQSVRSNEEVMREVEEFWKANNMTKSNEEFMREVMEREELEKQQIKKHKGGRPPKKK